MRGADPLEGSLGLLDLRQGGPSFLSNPGFRRVLGQRREGYMRVAGAELSEGERGMALDILIVEERDQDRDDPLIAGPGETQDHHLPG